ncbi:protoporphyrinogen/coproporphyrinogen oxidase [Streptomyces blattellae]|uniref:protoporphyrinogen/coproporphyrinogen oxidase n=1 Tax=Streptomyces blattellae TaxID=2569855 RepID=UPI0012B8DF82|nr:FAD-dependent oxidoreductase [Streptomyces blattellae]
MNTSQRSASETTDDVRPEHDSDIVVVGGGIAGLAAAFRLHEQGWSVTVLEAAEAVGGRMSTVERDGYVLNRGATMLPESFTNIVKLTEDAGLGKPFKPLAVTVGMPRDGRMRFLVRRSGPGALLDLVGTDLLSFRSKLLMPRLAVDLRRWRRQLANDKTYQAAARLDNESVASYALRRLNQEILDYVLDPFLRALYLGETTDMSVVDLFLSLSKLGGGPMQYPRGIDFLAKRLASFVDVRTGATVQDVRHVDGGVRTVWKDSEGEHTLTTRGAVLAMNGQDLLPVYHDLSDQQRELIQSVRHKSVLKGIFALRRLPADVPTLIPVPRAAGMGLGITVVDSQSMPDSVPPGGAVISGHWVSEYSKGILERPDDELIPEMIKEMETVIPGLSAELEFVHVVRWGFATNARYRGFYDTVANIRRTLAEDDVIQLAGEYLALSGTNNSVDNGERAAAHLNERMRSLYGPPVKRPNP